MMFELLLPCGFFLLILGGSAVLVGALVSVGLFDSWIPQAIVFCAIAVCTWLFLGKKLQSALGLAKQQPGNLVGTIVTVTRAIPPGGSGPGELWGTSWRLINVDTAELPEGIEAVVIGSEGITLHVKKFQR